jgi:eukaryotic-like serine/threonine-protein kinase
MTTTPSGRRCNRTKFALAHHAAYIPAAVQLNPGARLGPYQIVERVGAGGMGEVYRARDTRLPRDVAIKVLPAEYSSDARLRLRLNQEAKTISALNHPHICMLFDVGHDEGLDYLVMEYCEGLSLAEKIAYAPLPIDKVLEYGVAIADALSRAHRAGIVHRDLKPSNIRLTKSGPKLLDFGLAIDRRGSRATDTTPSLEHGVAGTPRYMAPELLKGAQADARSDIFALGLVLYEMITARPAFSGSTPAMVAVSILEHDAPPLPESVPKALRHVIEKCLEKQPDDRWESAHDVAEELRWAGEKSTTPADVTRRSDLPVAIGALVLIAAIIALWRLTTPRVSERVVRYEIQLPTAGFIDTPIVALSPDGRRLAYAVFADGQPVHVRSIDSQDAPPLPGTEGAASPFFSPDGQWIGYVIRGKLMKSALAGGAPQTITAGIALAGRGATWAPDGTIYFAPSPSGGLWKVRANGGTAVPVTQPDASAGENSHRWPQILPDGKHVLFTIRTDGIGSFDDAKIAVLSTETGKWHVLLDGGTCGRYVPDGHLLFGRGGALYEIAFDLRSLSTSGSRRKVAEPVLSVAGSGAVHYTVSNRGDLVYVPLHVTPRTLLLSFDRQGHSKTAATLDFNVDRVSLSPDGRKLAVSIYGANNDIWIYDMISGQRTRLSFERGDESWPVWTADGSSVMYRASNPDRILSRSIDGNGEPQELLRDAARPTSCSPDGKFLVYSRQDPRTGDDLWLLPLRGDRTPQPLLQTAYDESEARFSPDGKWIAYASNQSGAYEVYLRSTTAGGYRQVSTNGGGRPRWSPDGNELFYMSRASGGIYRVPISGPPNDLHLGSVQLVTDKTPFQTYEVTDEGPLLLQTNAPLPGSIPITVVLNWSSELRQRGD